MISHQVMRLAVALQDFDADTPRLQAWGSSAARALTSGGRLLACADGPGSRELAHRLVAELRSSLGDDRPALRSAVVVPSDEDDLVHGPRVPGRSLAEQVLARGRPGDILLCLSAARPSDALLDAARTGAACGLTTWALTAPASALLADECSDAVAIRAGDARLVEEIHLVAIHVFCAAVDSCVRDRVRADERQASGKVA
jgi:D-sedoheptulose 7-phosphate isomerase